ncbi:MAG: hypothetical protein IPH20_04370 [Bacteroidales bacterium]|nr:hypothetical protein [Bacteroidales bacterium]
MDVQLETLYPAETLYRMILMKPEKRLLGIAANRWVQVEENREKRRMADGLS